MFPPTEEHPVRVDFFGDTVEEIRYFSVADQRSGDVTLTEVIASPCRELLLTDAVRARAAPWPQEHPELIEMLDKIAQGHAVDGMEALSPALVDGMELLVDLLPADTHVLVCDPELVRGRAIELVKTSEEFLHASWAAAAGGGQAPIDLGASSYRPLAEVRSARPGPRTGLVDAVPVQRRPGRRRPSTSQARAGHAPRTARSSTSRPQVSAVRSRVALRRRPGRRELSRRHRVGGRSTSRSGSGTAGGSC